MGSGTQYSRPIILRYNKKTTMMTPERADLSWQTRSSPMDELISYATYLKSRALSLQGYHERGMVRSPLYLLPGAAGEGNSEDSNGTVDGQEVYAAEGSSAISTETMAASVSTTPRQPLGNRFDRISRWKQIADQISKGWDKPNSWMEKRAAVGLDSAEQNKFALTAILGLKKDLLLHLGQEEVVLSVSRPCTNDATDILVMSARQYALDSNDRQRNPGLITQIKAFRELVFASLCVVMEHQGIAINTIENLMRICISSSGSANLYRLRRGALWVNRMISGTLMKQMGWGHASTEFFVLCGFLPIVLKRSTC